MPTRKKCRHCNTDNPAGALYCVACGKYLVSKKMSNENELQAMSGYGISLGASASDDLNNTNSQYRVCKYHAPTKKGILPMSCSNCGYFFQVGLDLIVKDDALQDSISIQQSSTSSTNTPQVKQHVSNSSSMSSPTPLKPPMPTVSKDNSQLRLFWLNRINEMPIQIPHKGVTLGSKGVLLKEIPGNTLFMIWHTPAGWYLRCINETLLYNGAPINLNIDTRLLNNDSIIISDEQFRVEVI